MNRREVIALLGAVAIARPSRVRAQSDGMRKIGVLMGRTEDDPLGKKEMASFVDSLKTLGWREKENVKTIYRWSGSNVEQIGVDAASLVASKPDVILALSTPESLALLRLTRTIPIVFVGVADPEGTGLVKSLAQPGGNATGTTNYEPGTAAKWVELLREVAPGTRHVGSVFDGANPASKRIIDTVAAATHALGFRYAPLPLALGESFEPTLEALGRGENFGLIVTPGNTIVQRRRSIIELCLRERIPAVYSHRFFAEDGGLIAYGVDQTKLFGRAAGYVDRILRGANAADLPVQAPTEFQLLINAKTAKAVGLSIPPSLLARADEVIE